MFSTARISTKRSLPVEKTSSAELPSRKVAKRMRFADLDALSDIEGQAQPNQHPYWKGSNSIPPRPTIPLPISSSPVPGVKSARNQSGFSRATPPPPPRTAAVRETEKRKFVESREKRSVTFRRSRTKKPVTLSVNVAPLPSGLTNAATSQPIVFTRHNPPLFLPVPCDRFYGYTIWDPLSATPWLGRETINVDLRTQMVSSVDADGEVENETDAEAVIQVEIEPEAQAVVQMEIETEAEPVIPVEMETEAEPVIQMEIEAEAELVVEVEVEVEAVATFEAQGAGSGSSAQRGNAEWKKVQPRGGVTLNAKSRAKMEKDMWEHLRLQELAMVLGDKEEANYHGDMVLMAMAIGSGCRGGLFSAMEAKYLAVQAEIDVEAARTGTSPDAAGAAEPDEENEEGFEVLSERPSDFGTPPRKIIIKDPRYICQLAHPHAYAFTRPDFHLSSPPVP